MTTVIKTLKTLLGNIVLPRTSAAAVSYDNTTSGLEATTVKNALDELEDGKEAADANIMKKNAAQIMTADLTVNNPALADAKARNSIISNVDLTPGVSELAAGVLYFFYESS